MLSEKEITEAVNSAIVRFSSEAVSAMLDSDSVSCVSNTPFNDVISRAKDIALSTNNNWGYKIKIMLTPRRRFELAIYDTCQVLGFAVRHNASEDFIEISARVNKTTASVADYGFN